MRFQWRRQGVRRLLAIALLSIIGGSIALALFGFFVSLAIGAIEDPTIITHNMEYKAFINSAYYYPTSTSLGDNALALVLSINRPRAQDNVMDMKWRKSANQIELMILAKNETNSIVVSTPYTRITPHDICPVIAVFLTVQLLPNLQSISMVSDDGITTIPYTIPSYKRIGVVVCTSPLFVSEHWQNFLFAAHIYKKYGAFMNLYLISAVSAFFEIMKEYEKEGYLVVQPWVSVKFPHVSPWIADPYNDIEFRNQAAAQTDCLLKYKESADYVTFLDLDDVLIPRLAPTYSEEFAKFMRGNDNLAYIFYHKENYDTVTVRDSSKFSIKAMFNKLEYKGVRETGKIVVDPRHLNFTWIHFPPTMPNGKEKLEVQDNVITHLKNIRWDDEDHDAEDDIAKAPKYFNSSTETIISKEDILDLEHDLKRMMNKSRVKEILPHLPRKHHYADIIGKCYEEKYYRFHYAGRIGEITCPGPQLCAYHQVPDIKCMHVNATHPYMRTLFPITYYYAYDPYFTQDVGCYPH